jgi:dGTP triphosphohydrolase
MAKAKAKAPARAAGAAKSAAVKSHGKSGGGRRKGTKDKSGLAFSTAESRRRALERVKCAIWGNLAEINDGIMNLAKAGNYSAAKALFDLAGVYTLPVERAGEAEAAGPAAAEEMREAPAEAEDAASEPERRAREFYRTLGMKPPEDEPEPDMAA